MNQLLTKLRAGIYRPLMLLMVLICALTAQAYDFEVDGVYYSKNEGGETVAVTYGNKKYTGDIVIPETVTYESTTYPVTSIGASAFSHCSDLTSVEIPQSVTTIGAYAFRFCSGLTSVEIPNSVTSIGDNAFYECTGLTSVEIPNYVTSIGEYAFFCCSGLTSVVIGNSVISIGNCAFYGCIGLTSFEIPNSVTSIGGSAFYGCTGLTSVEIPNSVTSIGSRAFVNCSNLKCFEGKYASEDGRCLIMDGQLVAFALAHLDSYVIPNSVTSIGGYAFYGCTGLKSLRIEDGNSELSFGYEAIRNCNIETLYVGRNLSSQIPVFNSSSLTSVEIGNSVTSIGKYVFYGCTGLTSVTIPASVENIGEKAFYGCSGLTSVTIPASVENIGDNAFGDCTGLVDVTAVSETPCQIQSEAFAGLYDTATLHIPDGSYQAYQITSNWYLFKNLKCGDTEYPWCTDDVFNYRLDPITKEATLLGVVGTNNSPSIPDRVVYENGDEADFYQVTVIGGAAFANSYIASVKLPINLKTIGNNAFSKCTKLTSITFPNALESICDNAFNNCNGITSVTFPESVRRIGTGAFYQCGNLKSVTLPQQLDVLGDNVFNQCTKLADINKIIVPAIGNNAFAGTALTSVEIECEEIGEQAFYQCKNLESVTLPEQFALVGNDAFNGCTKLATINKINASAVGNNAFQSTALASVEIECNEIGDYAFYQCGNLEEVTITAEVIGAYAFSACNALKQTTINTQKIGAYSFYNCNGLEEATITAEVIGEYAFSACDALKQATIITQELGAYSFYNCNGLEEATITAEVIGEYAFAGTSKTSLKTVTGIKGDAPLFREIGEYAFSNSVLTSFDFSETETIGASAFESCDFTDIIISPSVQSVGSKAFANNPAVSATLADGTEPLELPADLFSGTSVSNLYVGRNFTGGNFSSYGLNALTIGNLVTELPEGAFQGCSSLKTLALGSGLTGIPANAFSGCSALTEVVIPKNITAIADNAFASCSNTTRVAIGAGVTNIGAKVFDGINATDGVFVTAVAPPAVSNNNTFSNYAVHLYVPVGSVDVYYNYPRCWYRFGQPLALVAPTAVNAKGQTEFKDAKPGDKFHLEVSVEPANVSLPHIFWRSTNPAVAIVDNNGNVTVVDPETATFANNDNTCEILAETLYADAPVATFKIKTGISSDIEDSIADEGVEVRANDVYNMQGLLIIRNATDEQISKLSRGIYIIGGKKVLVN